MAVLSFYVDCTHFNSNGESVNFRVLSKKIMPHNLTIDTVNFIVNVARLLDLVN